MSSESMDFEENALDVRKRRLAGQEWAEDAEELGQPRKIAYQTGETTLPRILWAGASSHYRGKKA